MKRLPPTSWASEHRARRWHRLRLDSTGCACCFHSCFSSIAWAVHDLCCRWAETSWWRPSARMPGHLVLVLAGITSTLAAVMLFPQPGARGDWGRLPCAFASGVQTMVGPVFILLAAWILGSVIGALGTAELIAGLAARTGSSRYCCHRWCSSRGRQSHFPRALPGAPWDCCSPWRFPLRCRWVWLRTSCRSSWQRCSAAQCLATTAHPLATRRSSPPSPAAWSLTTMFALRFPTR